MSTRLRQPGMQTTGTAYNELTQLDSPLTGGTTKQYTGPVYQPQGNEVNGYDGIDVGDQPDNGPYDLSQLFPSSGGVGENHNTSGSGNTGGGSDPGLMNILSKYGYGVQGLQDARGELEKYGYGVQEGDFLRGRIQEPDGDIIDVFDPREGRTEDNNWWNNPISGGAWNYDNRGKLPQGEFSFGAPSGGPIPGLDSLPVMGGGGGSYGGGGGAAPQTPSGPQRGDIWSILSKLIGENGEGNNEILTRRVGRARDDMNSARKSQTDTYRAMLAERGLIGSGGEVLGASNLERELGDTFAQEESSIIADESERQDSRMMQALSLATGLTMDEARNEIERYKADITRELGLGNLDLGGRRLDLDRTLGLGNLALGNANLNQNWNQFAAQFGLDRERFANEVNNGNFDQLSRILDYILRSGQITSGGRV